jgi:hypothetical protein
VLLGGLSALLFVVWVPLTVLTRDLLVSNDGFLLVALASFAGVGVVVARRQPWNPLGWIMLGVALLALFESDLRLYLVLDYRLHRGGLPFGRAALYWNESYSLLVILFGLQAILLFPDGKLSARWRRVLRSYQGLAALFMACQFAGEATVSFGSRVTVDRTGSYSGSAGPTSLGTAIEVVGWLLSVAFLVFWASFVAYQVAAWRRSAGERREQLKWLAAGATCCVIGCIGAVLFGDRSTFAYEALAAAAVTGITAFPASIGIGILKYRLYEIDRLISRTVSYTILTGLLAGVFLGIVVIVTDVLPFSSTIGVAASTLAAVGLFTPLRRRVQHVVDRRFNRARYNAEATVAAFTSRLRDAVDLETIRDELLHAVDRAVEPAHTSVWISPSSTRDLPLRGVSGEPNPELA